MTEIFIDIDTSEIENAANFFEEFESFLAQDLNVAMESSLQLLESQISARTPVDLGALRASITHDIDESSLPEMIGWVGSPRGGVIEPYARVIEFGRKAPGRPPPVEAIKYWAVRKLQIPESEAWGAARLIALHIGYHGFTTIPKGARMFEKGSEASIPFINSFFKEAVARTVGRFKV